MSAASNTSLPAGANKAGRPTTPNSQSKEMQEYLLKFMPELTSALTAMSINRPKDAYAYLAQHMLSLSEYPNKDKVCQDILKHSGPNEEPSGPPMHIVIAGAPCSGKGTQCEVLKQKFNVVHISTGDLLRAEVKKGSELGKKASSYMEAGKLIPDELITSVVEDKLASDECKQRGWMLDGFPRTAAQAKKLEAAGFHADVFLQLNVPDADLIKRVTNRRTDPQTGKTYDIVNSPPPADVADRCVQRPDDTEEKIQTRLQAYHEAIDDIKEQYARIKVEVDGSGKKEDISKQLVAAVEKAQKQKK